MIGSVFFKPEGNWNEEINCKYNYLGNEEKITKEEDYLSEKISNFQIADYKLGP